LKKIGLLFGTLALAVVGLFVLSANDVRNMSDNDLDMARKKAFDEGNENLFKVYDWETNRRSNENYEKENQTPKERVYREHAGILKFEK